MSVILCCNILAMVVAPTPTEATFANALKELIARIPRPNPALEKVNSK